MASGLDLTLEELASKMPLRKRVPRGPSNTTRRGGITKQDPVPRSKTTPRIKNAFADAENAAARALAIGKSKAKRVDIVGLPTDITEAQIKEYLTKMLGHIKSVEIKYNKFGNSRGQAMVTFNESSQALRAVDELNGMLIDKKPIKVSLMIDGSAFQHIPVASLANRVTKLPPSNRKQVQAPKSAKSAKSAPTRAAKASGRGMSSKRNKKPKPKSVAELDAEMQDYFGTEQQTVAAAGASVADGAVAGDAVMDEIANGAVAGDAAMDEIE